MSELFKIPELLRKPWTTQVEYVLKKFLQQTIDDSSQTIRPPLPPKSDGGPPGGGPVAPPRKNGGRKSSIPDSPLNGRANDSGGGLARSSTLPRKTSSLSMVGRPLPPPPQAQHQVKDSSNVNGGTFLPYYRHYLCGISAFGHPLSTHDSTNAPKFWYHFSTHLFSHHEKTL